MNHVEIRRQGRIAVVSFDRGSPANPLSYALMRELTEAARSFEHDADTSAIVLAGRADNFCMGFDLKDPETLALNRASLAERRRQRFIRAELEFVRAGVRAQRSKSKKRLETFSLDAGIDDKEGGSMKQDIQANTLDPEELYIKNQRILLMRGVIERLNPKYRRLIELRYLKEYSYGEISKEMDIPLGTVKAQLFRAKELLSNILKGKSTKY